MPARRHAPTGAEIADQIVQLHQTFADAVDYGNPLGRRLIDDVRSGTYERLAPRIRAIDQSSKERVSDGGPIDLGTRPAPGSDCTVAADARPEVVLTPRKRRFARVRRLFRSSRQKRERT
jgi:hypothetical protein